jgi:hypothetical protein
MGFRRGMRRIGVMARGRVDIFFSFLFYIGMTVSFSKFKLPYSSEIPVYKSGL